MDKIDERLSALGLRSADILLPKKGSDMEKWAVVACDQYTSDKDYWKKVEELTDGYPTTLSLIFPECYLEDEGKQERIENIEKSMDKYLESGLLEEHRNCFVLVKRTTGTGTRYGLMVALDLECYDYSRDSKSLIRATEGTILERIPPRKEIRKNASLELPHIMVLISDKEKGVIEPLAKKIDELEVLYDTDLMMDGGHVTGYLVSDDGDKEGIADGLEHLYSQLDPSNPLLYAMGDGNHSLATAKSCWEDLKKDLSDEERKNHPARFALVELENIYDDGLMFEPIHRVFFGIDENDFHAELIKNSKNVTTRRVGSLEEIEKEIGNGDKQKFGIVTENGFFVTELTCPTSFLAAGTIQSVIDDLVKSGKCSVDYIHGADVTTELGSKKGNLGVILPDVSKDTFFESILKDKAFPRKTFSIGHANEKRFYMEARRIV